MKTTNPRYKWYNETLKKLYPIAETSVVSQQGVSSINVTPIPGPKGDPGEPGYTPVKDVDYFDGAPGSPGEKGGPGVDGKDGMTQAQVLARQL